MEAAAPKRCVPLTTGRPSPRSVVSAPHALEPGTVLVDRYRLEEQQGRTGDTTYWRATDELLDRPVGVCLLPADGATAAPVLHAARQAAAVTDPRFLRVLDAA